LRASFGGSGGDDGDGGSGLAADPELPIAAATYTFPTAGASSPSLAGVPTPCAVADAAFTSVSADLSEEADASVAASRI
jgi:hypothetical protein